MGLHPLGAGPPKKAFHGRPMPTTVQSTLGGEMVTELAAPEKMVFSLVLVRNRSFSMVWSTLTSPEQRRNSTEPKWAQWLGYLLAKDFTLQNQPQSCLKWSNRRLSVGPSRSLNTPHLRKNRNRCFLVHRKARRRPLLPSAPPCHLPLRAHTRGDSAKLLALAALEPIKLAIDPSSQS